MAQISIRVDENVKNHPLKEQAEMAKNYRNIGLGIMGLHDMLIKMGTDDGKFDENIRSGISPTRLDDALTVIKKAMNDNTIDTSNITDDMFRGFEATAIKRVNIDRYATEVMAKTGLPTTGSINLALAAVRLADFQASTNANDLAFNNYI